MYTVYINLMLMLFLRARPLSLTASTYHRFHPQG